MGMFCILVVGLKYRSDSSGQIDMLLAVPVPKSRQVKYCFNYTVSFEFFCYETEVDLSFSCFFILVLLY